MNDERRRHAALKKKRPWAISPFHWRPRPKANADWLLELKSRIHTAQQRAALAVNRELVLLYWQIGRDILARHRPDATTASPRTTIKKVARRACIQVDANV